VIPLVCPARFETAFYHLFVLRDRLFDLIFDLMGKTKGRGRPRIRTAEYWREYYRRKQREWRAAHPRIGTEQKQKQRDK
jgi:hypothetical protein